eukprot:g9947.t1
MLDMQSGKETRPRLLKLENKERSTDKPKGFTTAGDLLERQGLSIEKNGPRFILERLQCSQKATLTGEQGPDSFKTVAPDKKQLHDAGKAMTVTHLRRPFPELQGEADRETHAHPEGLAALFFKETREKLGAADARGALDTGLRNWIAKALTEAQAAEKMTQLVRATSGVRSICLQTGTATNGPRREAATPVPPVVG